MLYILYIPSGLFCVNFTPFKNNSSFLSFNSIFSFSLKDKRRFQKCANIAPVQGSSVYKEIATGYYWYKDNFHRTHYEVFDSFGKKHLGEASLDGIIDKGKADKGKHSIL